MKRNLARWWKQYESSKCESGLSSMVLMHKWLEDHLPSNEKTTLIHGDYRFFYSTLIVIVPCWHDLMVRIPALSSNNVSCSQPSLRYQGVPSGMGAIKSPTWIPGMSSFF